MKIEAAGRAAMLRGLVSACSKGKAILYSEGGPTDVITVIQLEQNAMMVSNGSIRLAGSVDGQTGALKTGLLKGIMVVDRNGAPVMTTENVENMRIYENSIVSINDMTIPVKFVGEEIQHNPR